MGTLIMGLKYALEGYIQYIMLKDEGFLCTFTFSPVKEPVISPVSTLTIETNLDKRLGSCLAWLTSLSGVVRVYIFLNQIKNRIETLKFAKSEI